MIFEKQCCAVDARAALQLRDPTRMEPHVGRYVVDLQSHMDMRSAAHKQADVHSLLAVPFP